MATRFRKAFFAFPSAAPDLVGTINAASELVQKSSAKVELVPWPQLEIFGANIPDVVRNGIRDADVFVADVTRPNFNVYYEFAFAIGLGKAVAPVLNVSFANATDDIQKDGFFDNIGYAPYENSAQLADILQNLPETKLRELYERPINFPQPIFLLDTYRKTDFRNAIVSAIKKSRAHFRNFDPVEMARFSTVPMIADTTSASGIIVPLLGAHIDDAARHNLRAAFTAGLAHGLGRQTLLLQLQGHDPRDPADYRDFIIPVRSEDEIRELVVDFCKSSSIAGQSIAPVHAKQNRSALQEISLGASAAENEFRTLSEYFVETAEFIKTMRGEVSIVAGRKGSGKTAIFFQARDYFREMNNCIVTDLKPESHQLSLFREELLKLVDVGVFDHTIAAFWYFLILSEVLLAIKEQKDFRARFDGDALAASSEIEKHLAEYRINESGDFTSRINRLGSYLLQEIERIKASGESLTADHLTNLIFRGGISRIRSLILKFSSKDNRMVVLLDNIDKGWPTTGVPAFDVRLIRLMIESFERIRRDFRAADREFLSVVFLRNDIYELLVEETPDRGKIAHVRIDWTDRAKLRQVIYNRLVASAGGKATGFAEIWRRYFPEEVHGEDSFEYFTDHCLMRPRFLINMIENAIANAINRSRSKVEEVDCVDAVRQHSLYLVNDFGYEIRDVSGISADILYTLIGATKFVTRAEVLDRFQKFGIGEDDAAKAFRLMLWYGILGIAISDKDENFIYDYEYNMKHLEAEARALGDDALYVVNPALHVALA